MEVLEGKIGGVILAGGKGRRMGREKAFIELGGKRLIERTADTLALLFSEVVIIADAPERFRFLPYRCEADAPSGLGPIGGLATALRVIQKEAVFVVACDMPFLNPDVIRSMIDDFDGEDLLIPMLSNQLHPLHALYSRRCLPAIQAQIKEGSLALHRLVNQVKGAFYPEEAFRKWDPSLLSVMNVNTPDDLEQARRLLA